MLKRILLLLFISLMFNLHGQKKSPLYVDSNQMKWVNAIYDSMTLDEKIGQLFMASAYSNKDDTHKQEIIDLIKKEHIGGLIFMQDDAEKQVELVNEYQQLSKYPLLIGMDAEWDVSMRLKNSNKFPWAMTCGALTDESLLYEMGDFVSKHLKMVGAHFNFAPVSDVNVNPLNPIIGNRSYGSDPENVAKKGLSYAKGMQKNSILASAKHFPGHGDTDKDSHKTLPTISHDISRLEAIELIPFQKLIDGGITAIMVAHLNIPALEKTENVPASLSKNIVTNLLKNKMGFEGIIITDALNMQGVTNHFPNGMTDYMAFEAGNDILLFSQAVAKGKAKIRNAIETGIISESRLEESVKKILMAKYKVGLHDFEPISKDNLISSLNDNYSTALTQKIFEQSATLIENHNNLLPISDLKDKNMGWIGLEEGEKQTFLTYLRKYTNIDEIDIKDSEYKVKLKNYDYVFISIHKDNSSPYKSYKISQNSLNLIKEIGKKTNVILTIFGSPYALKDIDPSNINSLIVAYQNHEFAMQAVPQMIFGALPFMGKLPVDVNENYTYGKSIKTQSIKRLGYTLPENVGLSSNLIYEIDNIAEEAIKDKATPGMQVVVAKDGKVIIDKSYGYFTYDKTNAVQWNSLYDIASITKVVSTIPLIMDQVQNKHLSIDTHLKNLVPSTKFSDKADVTVKEVLAHQGGFYPWIPFYKKTLDQNTNALLPHYYSHEPKQGYDIHVADNLYLVNHYPDSMLLQIMEKESVPKKYKYSDLGYYIFQNYLERSSLKKLDVQIENKFFSKLGMNYTIYNPLRKFNLNQIVPTEYDNNFRKQLIHGYVHDQGAAMMGGIAGHAGVFSNANDLAKIMQMYLNKGEYGAIKFIKPSTLKKFTKFQYKLQGNRRGLGFDKQLGTHGPAVPIASQQAFGHSGFTGTLVWADPAKDLIFVFLSNRVHPSAENRKLIKLKIREKMLEKIYLSL